jgi:hypothetical protein
LAGIAIIIALVLYCWIRRRRKEEEFADNIWQNDACVPTPRTLYYYPWRNCVMYRIVNTCSHDHEHSQYIIDEGECLQYSIPSKPTIKHCIPFYSRFIYQVQLQLKKAMSHHVE